MDVNKLCFLCFQKFERRSVDDTEEEPHFQTISLQSVLHYLSSGGEDGESGGGGDEVVVCQECYCVASGLSLLCVRLQEIQLKIEYSLELFSEKLRGRGSSGEEARKGSWNEQALKLYRHHILQKCKSKLRCKRQLIVTLDKLLIVPVHQAELVKEEEPFILEPPPPASPQQQEEFPADDNDTLMEEGPPAFEMEFFEEPVTSMTTLIMKPPPSPTEIFDQEPFQEAEVDAYDEPPPVLTEERSPKLKKKRGRPRIHPPNLFRSSSSSPSKQKEKRSRLEPCPACGLEFSCKWERADHIYTHRRPRTLNLKNSETNRVLCPNCQDRVTWVRGGDQQLDLHNYIFHLDVLFASSKLPNIPPSHFNDYCKHLLHSQGYHSKIQGPNGSISYTCQQCPMRCRCSFKSFASLRSHLIQKHKEVLCGKLEELQRDICPDKLKEVLCPPLRDDTKCQDCGATFSKYTSLKRHLRESCKFRRDKSIKSHKACKCQECGMRFGSQVYFYRHRRKVHPNSIKPAIMLK